MRWPAVQAVVQTVVLAAVHAVSVCQSASAAAPQTDRFTLENGIRVVVFHVPESTNAAIFTYLPMGLASDAPGRAQWSHLIEHLVLRSTVPSGSPEANAETLPDHMRLDSYGTVKNWQEGLSHHARWLEGVPFTDENLQAEKPRVNAECDITARILATHKFALAAWAQGCRHARAHVALKGDVERATLGDVQKWRDEHLVVLDRTVVCIVGGLDAETIKPIVRQRLERIRSKATPVAPVQLHHADRDMTWDLSARHLLFTWRIPGPDDDDHAALMVAAQWLATQFFADPQLKRQTGMVLAGADLALPEGHVFYVSVSLRPEGAFCDVRKMIEAHLEALRTGDKLGGARMIGRSLALPLTVPTDPAEVKANAPANVTLAMIEGNIGLQWGMHEYRYGEHRTQLADMLKALTPERVAEAARTHLAADTCAVVTLLPGPIEKTAGPTTETGD